MQHSPGESLQVFIQVLGSYGAQSFGRRKRLPSLRNFTSGDMFSSDSLLFAERLCFCSMF